MLFPSEVFLFLFLPFVLAVYYLVLRKHTVGKNIFLFIMSLLFYAYGEPKYVFLMLFMILFPSTVASAFTSDERLIETVRWTMPVFLGGMTIFGLQRACQNMFVALGQAKISIFIALLRKVILLIPLALILPHYMGVTGVYAAEAISDATAAICCTLLFFWQFPKILGKIQGNILHTD